MGVRFEEIANFNGGDARLSATFDDVTGAMQNVHADFIGGRASIEVVLYDEATQSEQEHIKLTPGRPNATITGSFRTDRVRRQIAGLTLMITYNGF